MQNVLSKKYLKKQMIHFPNKKYLFYLKKYIYLRSFKYYTYALEINIKIFYNRKKLCIWVKLKMSIIVIYNIYFNMFICII